MQWRGGSAGDGPDERAPGGKEPSGVFSRRLLADLQARAMATDPSAVVLVEGISDCIAVEATAALYGRNIRSEGVVVVPMGGATNLGQFVAQFGTSGSNARLAGLCDLAEEEFFGRTLARAGVAQGADRAARASAGFFVCERDLEDELIRALGATAVEELIEREGELESLRKLQQMPFHRGRPIEDQLHRFMGVRSGRKYRYAALLVGALEVVDVPRPLHDLLETVTRPGRRERRTGRS